MTTATDAAEFVRSRLQAFGARINQDEMRELISDLKEMMGRTLSASDVGAVVAAFQELTLPAAAFLPSPRASAPASAMA